MFMSSVAGLVSWSYSKASPAERCTSWSEACFRTSRLSLEGRQAVLGYLRSGEPLNLIPALDCGAILATADALTHSTVCAISCGHFRDIVRHHPEVTHALLEHLAAEVRRLSDMVESLALYTVRTRLARFLLAQAEGEQPA